MEASKSEIQAWEYNSTDENEKLAHKYHPNRAIPLSHVHGLGILTWKLDVDNWESDTELKNIRSDRGYKYSEVITVSREAMVDFDARVKGFFKEHMHSQEESRLILDGSGTKLTTNGSAFTSRKATSLFSLPACTTGSLADRFSFSFFFFSPGTAAVHGKSQNLAEQIFQTASLFSRKLYVEKYLLQQRVKAQ